MCWGVKVGRGLNVSLKLALVIPCTTTHVTFLWEQSGATTQMSLRRGHLKVCTVIPPFCDSMHVTPLVDARDVGSDFFNQPTELLPGLIFKYWERHEINTRTFLANIWSNQTVLTQRSFHRCISPCVNHIMVLDFESDVICLFECQRLVRLQSQKTNNYKFMMFFWRTSFSEFLILTLTLTVKDKRE